MEAQQVKYQQVEYIVSLMTDGANVIEMGPLAKDVDFADAFYIAQSLTARAIAEAMQEGDYEKVASFTLCLPLTLFVTALNIGIGWERQRRSEAKLDNMIDLKD